jgi:hypothetical protein
VRRKIPAEVILNMVDVSIEPQVDPDFATNRAQHSNERPKNAKRATWRTPAPS